MTDRQLTEFAPLFAVLRGLEPNRAADVGEALVQGGFEILEVTMNSPDPIASIRAIADRVAGRALIGAGTVTRIEDLAELAAAGARIIVSPHTDVSLIAAARARGLITLPGIFTASEAFAALGAGASGLKIFPAEAMPPEGVKALRAVLPPTAPIYVVGGISADNMAGYLRAGANGFGIGSSLFRPGKPLAQIEADARHFVEAFHAAREAN